jgi:hypothetical protein
MCWRYQLTQVDLAFKFSPYVLSSVGLRVTARNIRDFPLFSNNYINVQKFDCVDCLRFSVNITFCVTRKIIINERSIVFFLKNLASEREININTHTKMCKADWFLISEIFYYLFILYFHPDIRQCIGLTNALYKLWSHQPSSVNTTPDIHWKTSTVTRYFLHMFESGGYFKNKFE